MALSRYSCSSSGSLSCSGLTLILILGVLDMVDEFFCPSGVTMMCPPISFSLSTNDADDFRCCISGVKVILVVVVVVVGIGGDDIYDDDGEDDDTCDNFSEELFWASMDWSNKLSPPLLLVESRDRRGLLDFDRLLRWLLPLVPVPELTVLPFRWGDLLFLVADEDNDTFDCREMIDDDDGDDGDNLFSLLHFE